MKLKVRVRLTNRYAEFIKPYPEKQFKNLFGYLSPAAFFTPAYKRRDSNGNRLWDGMISFLKYGRVPSGLFLSLKDKIEEDYRVIFRIKYRRKKPKFKKLKVSDKSKRKYQNECIRAMRKNSRVGGIILAATGTGKTYIAGKYFKALIGKGVFIVDELGLLDQAKEEIASVLGEEVGYIGNMRFRPQRITIATAQTMHLHRHDPKFTPWLRSLDVVIIDELHEMLSKRNHEIVSSIHPKACFGMTATLRHQKKHIRMKATALTGPIIYEFPLKKGVKQKFLTPGIVVGVDIEKAGYGHLEPWPEYDKLIAKSKKYNDVIEKIIRRGIKRKKHVLHLVQRPKHIRILTRRFKDIPHKLAYGAIKVRDRTLAKQEFEKKELKLLIANQVMKKGTNIKRVDMIVDAASMASYNDAAQKYGRGVRLCDNKKGLIYFDIGFINLPGVTSEHYMWNRFEKAARVRRRALKRLGVPVYILKWKDNPKYIVRFAEKKLKQLVKNT